MNEGIDVGVLQHDGAAYLNCSISCSKRKRDELNGPISNYNTSNGNKIMSNNTKSLKHHKPNGSKRRFEYICRPHMNTGDIMSDTILADKDCVQGVYVVPAAGYRLLQVLYIAVFD